MSNRLQGKVLWFNEVKGYGFIKQNAGGEDIFVHFRDIVRNTQGEHILYKEQNVTYILEESEKGLVAKSVECIS